MSRIFAIPDIHGRLDLLQSLWKRLEIEEQIFTEKGDKVVFMGDYVDRGPNSKGVLEFIKARTEAMPGKVIALQGNHEDLMLRACSTGQYDDEALWRMNGGDKTIESFNGKIDEKILEWVDGLPFFHEEPGFFFSHAPAPRESWRNRKGIPYTQNELQWTYSRDEFGIANRFEGKIGVCGHVHGLGHTNKNFQPRFYEHYFYLDAGCGCHYKAPLVAVEVRSKKVISAWPVEAQETHCDGDFE